MVAKLWYCDDCGCRLLMSEITISKNKGLEENAWKCRDCMRKK